MRGGASLKGLKIASFGFKVYSPHLCTTGKNSISKVSIGGREWELQLSSDSIASMLEKKKVKIRCNLILIKKA